MQKYRFRQRLRHQKSKGSDTPIGTAEVYGKVPLTQETVTSSLPVAF